MTDIEHRELLDVLTNPRVWFAAAIAVTPIPTSWLMMRWGLWDDPGTPLVLFLLVTACLLIAREKFPDGSRGGFGNHRVDEEYIHDRTSSALWTSLVGGVIAGILIGTQTVLLTTVAAAVFLVTAYASLWMVPDQKKLALDWIEQNE